MQATGISLIAEGKWLTLYFLIRMPGMSLKPILFTVFLNRAGGFCKPMELENCFASWTTVVLSLPISLIEL